MEAERTEIQPGVGAGEPPWSAGVARRATGELEVAGVPVSDLAGRFGTPVYVLDEADLRARARAYRDAFTRELAPSSVHVYYAGKAFLSIAVARWVHAEGLRIDTATGGELAVALRAGIPGADIGMHGNNKSDAEIDRALAAGVGRIVVDSLPEVARVADAAARRGVRAPVMVRVTTGVHAGGHEYISTAHEDQKFGLSIAAGRAEEAVAAVLARPELELLGLHSHIGSQVLEAEAFTVAARSVLELRARIAETHGVLVGEVDLGGGYGVAYLPGEVPLDPAMLAAELARTVREVCAELGTDVPDVSIEPGRAIVAPAGCTLYTVGTVKPVRATDGADRLYVSVDGGMSDSIRPALYGAAYTATIASRASAAPPVRSRVVGKHCESGDIVVHDVDLPADVAAGDLLAVPATGAYGRSMASQYNLVPRPGVVAVAGGEARAVIRRETEEDVLALDLG
ncbi:diaminopimelate decarboxylase [Beutenbergia cavernae DSM 12333]|uniref:Diaminopimelate decarboxylase n=1 Tax=Beutenbergia cavernae (strain ATCC BAA-8 / DSM 12333 / CCUG 43141 / JCM 11478 / NBRC 16432 / NCIMB 13614 / HKI 0122) TaxID=471853 RepID=C5C1S2_BEUC1|nr:diaminopimelate decarboxylase [Beutenbergia cavernae]ACQ79540.1 diaminopimelate decarboxylase [Beutenbergia cavernae DSM 12333]